MSGLHRDWLVALPLLAEVPGTGWVAITEADIDNYAGMYLRKGGCSFALRAELSPRIDVPGIAVEADAPVTTPWRVLMIGDEPGRLVESNIILNLNPPSKIADTSWIRGGKVGVGLVVGRGCAERELQAGHEHRDHEALHRLCFGVGIPLHADRCGLGPGRTARPGGLRGSRRYHAGQSEHRYAGVAALRQGEECRIWLWSHWTSVDKYMDQAFPLFEKWGVAGVKIDFMNRDDQEMVRLVSPRGRSGRASII